MELAKDSRKADIRTASDRLRKKPSWRGTKAVNGISTKRLQPGSEYQPLWVAIGLAILILVIGWLLGVR
jgi:hypothetical protein